MTTPLIIYCYDAYCGWCYGFSSVVKKLEYEYCSKLDFEVLSGGMILPAEPRHISVTAAYIRERYPKVEQLTGVSFGEDYLWHIRNPSLSDWFPIQKPAIALCVFKEFHPNLSVQFACDLQYALHYEGRIFAIMKHTGTCWKNTIYPQQRFMKNWVVMNIKKEHTKSLSCAGN